MCNEQWRKRVKLLLYKFDNFLLKKITKGLEHWARIHQDRPTLSSTKKKLQILGHGKGIQIRNTAKKSQ
jgi:hypothetical protein